jgi:nucleotide-binding universal stress UspA family protein
VKKEEDMYKKIMAPMDNSEFSECVLPHIRAIAVGCKVPEVVLFRAIEPTQTPYISVDFFEEAEERAIASIKDSFNKTAEEFKADGISTSQVIVKGYAANEILEYAEKNNVDLIIISSHGSSGIVRWALGSVTDKVTRHATAPVLVVAPKACRI